MVGGPFVPSSGLSTARSLIANPVTLLSKDAPTLAYERQLTLECSRTNLAEFNRSYSKYCAHADILWRTAPLVLPSPCLVLTSPVVLQERFAST